MLDRELFAAEVRKSRDMNYPTTASQTKQIVVEHVSHQFSNGLHAVNDINFSVAPGEFVVIVGPSGCGKTTILNLIAGLMELQTGSVTISDRKPKCGRQDIAYMFAQDALLPWRSVIGNAVFGAEIHTGSPSPEIREQARELLTMVGLSGFERAYPRQLSHGMRQRVALVRTFLMSSSVLLMDEPFGALDAHTKLMLEQGLLQLWERYNRTVLFITHDLAEAILLADRILICSARPGTIKSAITIELSRPRNISVLQKDPLFHDYYQRIWNDLAGEMTL